VDSAATTHGSAAKSADTVRACARVRSFVAKTSRRRSVIVIGGVRYPVDDIDESDADRTHKDGKVEEKRRSERTRGSPSGRRDRRVATSPTRDFRRIAELEGT